MSDLWIAYRMRWKRRRLLWRAFRSKRQLTEIVDRTKNIAPNAILAFSSVRNEIERLPYFLTYYRNLGVRHFLMVDNGSDDGTGEFLRQQPDVSLWHTTRSYKRSRFGIDWLTWLQFRYGHRHWCVTVDADEFLTFVECGTDGLIALTRKLDAAGIQSFGTLMLDMYPKGRLGSVKYVKGQNIFEVLCWFDSDNFRWTYQPLLQNMWVQGGVRERCFFSDAPERAPTLNKTPLVKWNRRFVYVNSTHSLLPRSLNHVFDQTKKSKPTGALLHGKFLGSAIEKSIEEKSRAEHFSNSELYVDYYDSLIANPDMWCANSTKFTGWRQLQELGLISAGE